MNFCSDGGQPEMKLVSCTSILMLIDIRIGALDGQSIVKYFCCSEMANNALSLFYESQYPLPDLNLQFINIFNFNNLF